MSETKKPRRKHGTVLTLDEQLIAFCDKWEQDRAAKEAKYRKSAEHWKAKPGSGLVYTFDLRRAEHYAHELAMIAELRCRALVATRNAETRQSRSADGQFGGRQTTSALHSDTNTDVSPTQETRIVP